MPSPISPGQAEALGITTRHERMDNAELRFRLCASDGSSYIRTEAVADSGWQNSHLHRYVHELTVVQKGAMAMAEERPEGLRVLVLRAGESYLCPLNLPHNRYLLPGSVVHTVKYGDALPAADWVACPQLDPLCRALHLDAILERSDGSDVPIIVSEGRID